MSLISIYHGPTGSPLARCSTVSKAVETAFLQARLTGAKRFTVDIKEDGVEITDAKGALLIGSRPYEKAVGYVKKEKPEKREQTIKRLKGKPATPGWIHIDHKFTLSKTSTAHPERVLLLLDAAEEWTGFLNLEPAKVQLMAEGVASISMGSMGEKALESVDKNWTPYAQAAYAVVAVREAGTKNVFRGTAIKDL